MEKFKKYQPAILLALISILCISILVRAILVYRDNFGTEYSNSKSDFGTFGDYMNPFIGIVNILLLAYISFEVSRLEGQREKSSIYAQKRITICQMSNERAMEITKIFDLAPIEPPDDPKVLIEIQKAFIFFTSNNDHLFGEYFWHNMIPIARFRVNFSELIRVYNEIEQTKLDYATMRTNNDYLTVKQKTLTRVYIENGKEVLDSLRAAHLEINYEEAIDLAQLEAKKEASYTIFRMKKQKFLNKLNQFILGELERTK